MNQSLKIFIVLNSLGLLMGCNLDKIEDSTSGCPTPPKAEFTTDKATGAPPLSVTFTNTSTGATTYKWDFGNTQTSTAEEPGARQYTIAGNYTVRLIANSSNGCSDTAETVIMVIDPLAQVKACAQVTAQTNNGAAPSVVSFSAACSANATSFAWDFGDAASGASNTATGITANHAYNTDGAFNIKLTATGPGGDKDTTIVVTINQPANPPTAAFSYNNNGCYAPCTVDFTNTSTDAISFEWDFGDGSPISIEVSPIHQFVKQGSYIVNLKSTGSGGVDNESKALQINAKKFTKNFGGTGNEYGNSVQQTIDGGYIIVGSTSSEGQGGNDVYVIKTDSDGIFQWKNTIGGPSDDAGYSITQAVGGGYIITGNTNSIGNGSSDIYLLKLLPTGELTFAHTFGDSGYDSGSSVQQISDGGLIISGYSQNNLYLLKTDQAGSEIWSKYFGSWSQDFGRFAIETTEGSIIVVGGTTPPSGYEDIYLIKCSNNGDVIWEKSYGGSEGERGNFIQETIDGGFIILGTTGSLGTGNDDIYLLKTDKDGNEEWSKTFGGINSESGYSVRQTNDGGYILLGETNSIGSGLTEIWLIKTDNIGNIIWDKIFGGLNFDFAGSVQQTTDGGYIVIGSTFNGSDYDIILIKTDKDGNAQ